MKMNRLALLLICSLPAVSLQASSIAFPPGLVPFSSIANETAMDANGDVLVLGYSNPALQSALPSIPLPTSPNETFSDSALELAPGKTFSNVFVPTTEQRSGDFGAFSQPLIDPLTGTAFSANVIPNLILLGNNGFFAFEVGPSTTPTPEPSAWALGVGGGLALAMLRLGQRRTRVGAR